MVMGGPDSPSVGAAAVPPVNTRGDASAGRYVATLSSSRRRPSSTSINAATVVTILLIE
jgi:hypothetical protein